MSESMSEMRMEKPQSIFNLIKDDHRKVEGLFKEILDNNRFNSTIWSQIDMELRIHMEGEEKYFYPRLINAEETRAETLEAIEEHNAAKQEQSTIMNATGDEQIAKIKVLYDMIDHHIEEEEKQLFKSSKKVLSKEDEMEIGRQFMNNKMTMKKEMTTSTTTAM